MAKSRRVDSNRSSARDRKNSGQTSSEKNADVMKDWQIVENDPCKQ